MVFNEAGFSFSPRQQEGWTQFRAGTRGSACPLDAEFLPPFCSSPCVVTREPGEPRHDIKIKGLLYQNETGKAGDRAMRVSSVRPLSGAWLNPHSVPAYPCRPLRTVLVGWEMGFFFFRWAHDYPIKMRVSVNKEEENEYRMGNSWSLAPMVLLNFMIVFRLLTETYDSTA